MTPALPGWTLPLVAAAIGSAVVHLWAEHHGRRALVYACKPLTTALLLVLALALGWSLAGADPTYAAAIAVGLLASLAGDVFLMLPRDRFVAGLASFLVAHVAYLVAFTRGVPFGGRPFAFVPFLLVGAVLVAVLWPRLGRLRLPVLLYAAALVLMAGQAAARALVLGGTPATLAAVGAGLFVVSDGVLAVNRFHTPVLHAQRWIMSSYVAAQLCIALSVAPGTPSSQSAGTIASSPTTLPAVAAFLADSVPYANELTDGALHRVVVQTATRADTLPGILAATPPVVVGDSLVVGIRAEENRVVGLYAHDVRTGHTRRLPAPPDWVPDAVPALAPDGRHVAYLAQLPTGEGQGVVATVPEGRAIYRGPPARMLETDAGVDGIAWADARRFEIRIDLTYRVGGTQRLRGTLSPLRVVVDTIRPAPR